MSNDELIETALARQECVLLLDGSSVVTEGDGAGREKHLNASAAKEGFRAAILAALAAGFTLPLATHRRSRPSCSRSALKARQRSRLHQRQPQDLSSLVLTHGDFDDRAVGTKSPFQEPDGIEVLSEGRFFPLRSARFS